MLLAITFTLGIAFGLIIATPVNSAFNTLLARYESRRIRRAMRPKERP